MQRIKNERGIMLVASAFLIAVLAGTSAIFLLRSVNELHAIERDIDRARAYAAAEAGFQGSLSQLSTGCYTGFINSSTYVNTLYVNGIEESTTSATLNPDGEDFIVIQSTGTGDFITRSIEARVYLESNLSKYLLYANTPTFASGDNAQYGEPLRDPDTGAILYDDSGRERVAEDEFDRALMYFTGDWDINGVNVTVYGNDYVEGDLTVLNGQDGDIHGDIYVMDEYVERGTLTVDDTYDDGNDKNKMADTQIDTLTPINMTFYQNNNSIPSFGASPQSRYLEFVVSGDGTHTTVNEYNDRAYTTQINSYDIPSTSIVYVDGDAYIKGTIKGRVSLVASDDIFLQDSVVYANGLNHADPSDAAAFLARDKMFFCGSTMDVCGILYGEKIASNNPVFDAKYDETGAVNRNGKVELTLHGNRIMNGNSNLSYYPTRSYLYDADLKKYRPPGLPVTSVVSFVREI